MAKMSKNNPAVRMAGNPKPFCCGKEMVATKIVSGNKGIPSGMYWICDKCANKMPTR